MKPLYSIVVAILVIAANAHPENIEDVKELPQSKEPVVEAEASEPQARQERCTACSGSHSLKSHNDVLAAIQALPNAQVHTQESFEGCSSDKGCAGIKLKDGKVVQKFGNLESFNAAASANSGNEFQFQAAGSNVFEGAVPNGGPFWWMNKNSPFKNAGAGAGGHSEKFSKFQSSSFTSSSGDAGGVDLAANPFLNGEFSKLAGGFTSAGGNFGAGQGAGFGAGFGAGQGAAGFSAGQGAANFNARQGASSFNAGQGASGFNAGSNVNLIQNSQKSEYDFGQQQQTQQNIDELFQATGNVQAHETGGDLQQTCAGQGYICVHKAQCNNGVVNTNGGSLLQANTQKQYCNTRTEVCCRLETASLGAGNQGSLGVGSATFSGSSSQGSGLFSQSGSKQNSFGASGFGAGQSTQSGSALNSVERGTAGFGSNTNQFSGAGASQFGSSFANTNKFAGNGFGSTLAPPRIDNNFNNEVYKSTSQSNFVETDTFSSGSENAGVFRPGAFGTGLKPGIPYLPPVDTSTEGTNVVTSTAFITTPRPVTPRPISTPRTTTPGLPYLPPYDDIPYEPSESQDGTVFADPNPRPKINNELPSGCAAALKCTPIEFCTAEGVISTTAVVLTRDQEAYRVPLTDCKDLASGRIGKCCRDPFYTDPWPVNQLGKWVPDVFGGNDGKYTPDSRGSSNVLRPVVTVRPPTPPVTGGVVLNNFRSTPKPILPQGPNQVSPGFPSSTPTPGTFVQKTQFNQNSYSQSGRGQVEQGGRGVASSQGQGQFGVGNQGTFGQGSSYSQTSSSFGQGQVGQVGVGQSVTRGQGTYSQVGQGVQTSQGTGFGVTQGAGSVIRQGSGLGINKGQGFGVIQGGGQSVSQGFGTRVEQGQGFGVNQGTGFTVTQGGSRGVLQGQGVGVSQGTGFGLNQGGVAQGQGFGVTQGQGTRVTQGTGLGITQGQGFGVSQGQGQYATQGTGFGVTRGQGTQVSQGAGFGVSKGAGIGVQQGGGFDVTQGGGFGILQGQGTGIRQGAGFGVSQGSGVGVGFGQGQTLYRGQGQALTQGEQVSQESVHRVFLSRYGGSGQCGLLNPQKPYGNRRDLEVDFAEIPWQAMVLLQTNRSLLCGGVITRPDVVITSASCVEGLDAKNVLIKGGEWKLGIDDEPLPYQIVQVKHILRHPLYTAGSLKNDAAILVLTENLRLAKNIWPICLPSSTDTLDAFYNGAGECIVTGWGKTVLQAHLQGAIMHGVNVSLINPGECQNKLQQDYPHLLDNYEQDSCVCGQPTNPANNICKVDTGSALACTTGDGSYVLRGLYSWESGCQVGNQLAAFYKFDLEWYEWAIGLIESVRFTQYTTTQITKNKIITQVTGSTYKGGITSGVKGATVTGIKGFGIQGQGQAGIKGFGVQGQGQGINGFGLEGQSQSGEFSQFGATKFTGSGAKFSAESGENAGLNFGSELNGPLSKTFSATYTEKKFFQTEPKIVTYTTKPEIITYTTKPEYFTFTTKPKIVSYTTKPEIVTYTTKPEIITYTTKPKIVSYTTKPQIIAYETSGSATNPKYVSPNVSFTEVVGANHQHSAQCKCLENGKK